MDALVRRVLARYLERVGMEHPTEEAKKEYLKEHPQADPSKHTVQGEGDKGDPKGSDADAGHKAIDRLLKEIPDFDKDDIKELKERIEKGEGQKVKKEIDEHFEWMEEDKARKERQTKETQKKRKDNERLHGFTQDIVRDLGAVIPDSWREAKDTLAEEMDEILSLVNKAKNKAKGDKYSPDEERHTKDADRKLDSMMSNVEHNVRRIMRDEDADKDEKEAAKKMWEVVQKWHAGF